MMAKSEDFKMMLQLHPKSANNDEDFSVRLTIAEWHVG